MGELQGAEGKRQLLACRRRRKAAEVKTSRKRQDLSDGARAGAARATARAGAEREQPCPALTLARMCLSLMMYS